MKKWIGTLILLGGCMVGPNYCPPEVTIAERWGESEKIAIEWWKEFDDSELNALIEKASSANYDLAAAEAKIAEARALKQVAAAKLYPHIAADVNAKKYYFSKNGFLSLFDRAGLPPVIPQIDSLFNALFDVSWELDIFGKTRRTIEAAERYMESQIENRNGVLLSLLAEVASTYVDLRGAQQKLLLARRNVWVAEQELQIVLENVERGLSNKIQLDQAQQAFSDAKSMVPNLEADILTSIYSLSVLTGQLPEALLEELLENRPLPRIPAQVALGLRSDLVRRRPDVRKAERELAAATAAIGIAAASFFPTFSLSNQEGLQSLHWHNLFEWQSRTWNVGGDGQMPIFQGGKIVGNLHFTQALEIEKGKNYQQAVLSALKEAESSVANFKGQLQVVEERQSSLKSSLDIWSVTQAQYNRGLVNRLQALSSEKGLIQTEDQLVQSKQTALTRLITLYKALGGGWEKLETEACEDIADR